MAYTTTPQDNETIANLPGDIRAVTALVNGVNALVTSHAEATSAAHAAGAISYGSGTVETALNAAGGHAADQNNPHGVTPAQIQAVAVNDAVTTITANKVVRRDANGKIAGDITGNAATATLATSATSAANGVPAGVIAMWSGSAASVPSGWHLCDGTSGTPDLRDKFVLGAGHNYAPGAIGGEATHTLTVSEMPSHTHECPSGYWSDSSSSSPAGSTHGITNYFTSTATGGGGAHNNMPPYYALCYIMKV